MGISHFFEYSELKRLNNIFNYNQIDRNYYTDKYLGKIILQKYLYQLAKNEKSNFFLLSRDLIICFSSNFKD